MTRRRPRLHASYRGSISHLALGLLMACPAIAAAKPEIETASPVTVINRETIENLPTSRDMKAILDLHNNVRAEVGSAPLRWNQTLADGSQAHADRLAQSGVLKHSSRAERGNTGENLVGGPRSGRSSLQLARIWVDEGQFFHPGSTFPNICDGDWQQCGHYSQMVFSTTTDLGCGFARDRFIVLVCRYFPEGNMFGQKVLGVPPVLAKVSQDCWIDVKTGKAVPTAPFAGVNTGIAATLDAGTAVVSPDRQTAYNTRTGQNYAKEADGSWIDVKTGKAVPTAPFAGVNTGMAATIDAGTAIVSPDRQTAYNTRTGQNYARVPCPEPKEKTTPTQATAPGSGPPAGEVDTKVEQPELPSKEVFNPADQPKQPLDVM